MPDWLKTALPEHVGMAGSDAWSEKYLSEAKP
jgi:hypothetical protein